MIHPNYLNSSTSNSNNRCTVHSSCSPLVLWLFRGVFSWSPTTRCVSTWRGWVTWPWGSSTRASKLRLKSCWTILCWDRRPAPNTSKSNTSEVGVPLTHTNKQQQIPGGSYLRWCLMFSLCSSTRVLSLPALPPGHPSGRIQRGPGFTRKLQEPLGQEPAFPNRRLRRAARPAATHQVGWINNALAEQDTGFYPYPCG